MEGSLSKADENILVCLIIFALNPINNICDLKAANILPEDERNSWLDVLWS